MFSTLHKMFTGKTVSFLSMKTVLAVFMLMIGLSANAANVTYKPNKGSINGSTRDYTVNQTTYQFPEATRTGYRLNGWYTKSSGGTKVNEGANVTSTTLYAQWTRVYTISFDTHATDVTKPDPIYVANNETYGTLPTVSRTGYTFKGWYTSQNGNTKVSSTTRFTNQKDQTLHAQWTANTYKVTLNSNGGTPATNTIDVTYDAKYVALATATTPTKTGYKFAGWYTAETGGNQVTASDDVKITDNTTFYAHWTANTYTVTFDSNGGSAVSGITVTYDSPYGTLPTPTREAYVFAGWWTAAEGGTEVTALSTVDITAAQTLYAQWQERKMYIFANKVPNTNRYVTTFYDSKYAYTIPENVTAYTAVQNGNMFDLTPIEGEVIAKGEGVVLVTTEYNGQYELKATAESAEKIVENELIGVDEDTQVDALTYSEIFILSYTSNYGLGFYLLTGPSVVANKAFFGTPSASDAKNFGFRFLDRGTTGINSVATETTGIRKIAGANGIVIEKDGKQYNVAGGRIK